MGERIICYDIKKIARSDIGSDEDAMSDVSRKEDIFGLMNDNESSHSDDEDNTSVTSEESLEIDPWSDIVDEAFKKSQSQYDSKISEVMEEDHEISECEAKEKVFRNMKSTYRKAMMNSFGSKIGMV